MGDATTLWGLSEGAGSFLRGDLVMLRQFGLPTPKSEAWRLRTVDNGHGILRLTSSKKLSSIVMRAGPFSASGSQRATKRLPSEAKSRLTFPE
jgi:hypothetical protein